MLVCVALRKRDLAVDHDGTIPVPCTRLEIRDLIALRGLVDAQPAFGVIDVEQTSRYHRARAAVAVLPHLDELAVLERPGGSAAAIRRKHPRRSIVAPHRGSGEQHAARGCGEDLPLMALVRRRAGDVAKPEQSDPLV